MKDLNKILSILLTTLLVLFFLYSSSSAFVLFINDKDIHGQVLDAGTRNPLKGVVVHATWHTSMPTPAGPKPKFYDIYETLTDGNGDFVIKGHGIKLMTTMESPSINIFKAGYSDINLHDLGEKFHKYSPYKDKVNFEDNKAIILLDKLTFEERKKRNLATPSHEIPFEKVKYMWGEINKERVEIGYKPYRLNVNKK